MEGGDMRRGNAILFIRLFAVNLAGGSAVRVGLAAILLVLLLVWLVNELIMPLLPMPAEAPPITR
jgi:hypothetical protein